MLTKTGFEKFANQSEKQWKFMSYSSSILKFKSETISLRFAFTQEYAFWLKFKKNLLGLCKIAITMYPLLQQLFDTSAFIPELSKVFRIKLKSRNKFLFFKNSKYWNWNYTLKFRIAIVNWHGKLIWSGVVLFVPSKILFLISFYI